MSGTILCDLLNECYSDITPDLAHSIFSAIIAAENANEFTTFPIIYNELRALILKLANSHQDDKIAIRTYITNTRGSVTHEFLYREILHDMQREQINSSTTTDSYNEDYYFYE